MIETTKVEVDTEVEAYPVLSIREPGDRDGRTFDVPRALLDALDSAQDTVVRIQAAIMEHIAANHPDASAITDITDWVHSRANEPRWHAAVAAYEADHPDGPAWPVTTAEARVRYLDAAGYER